MEYLFGCAIAAISADAPSLADAPGAALGARLGESAGASAVPRSVSDSVPGLGELFTASSRASDRIVNAGYGSGFSTGRDRHAASVDWARWVINAGGGPLDVSMPWLLRDAGGRLLEGERGSWDGLCWSAKEGLPGAGRDGDRSEGRRGDVNGLVRFSVW
jgi:hypothetical protein